MNTYIYIYIKQIYNTPVYLRACTTRGSGNAPISAVLITGEAESSING